MLDRAISDEPVVAAGPYLERSRARRDYKLTPAGR